MGKDLFKNINKSIKETEKNNKLKNKNDVTNKNEQVTSLLPPLKLELVKYSMDDILNSFLAEKTLKLKTVQANASIILGEIFQEVKEKLGGKNQYDGIYIKWLEDNGFNKMTALRHRNRYELVNSAKTDNGKLTIATLPTRLIQELIKVEDGKKIYVLNEIDEGATKAEIEKIIGEEIIEEKKEEKVKIKPITPFYKPIFAFEKKIDKMTNKESYKALEELRKIKKEVSKLERLLEEKREKESLQNNLTLPE